MTLEQLRMLIAVADAGSLKKASERLYKTQPAVSQGITKLEQQLSVTLFSRASYRLTLTHPGQVLYQHARRVLNESDRLSQMATHFAEGFETQVHLAIEASFDLSLLLPTLEQVQADYPKTQIILSQEYLSGAWQKLKSGAVDIAISPISPQLFEVEPIQGQLIYTGQLKAVAAPKLIQRLGDLTNSEQLLDEYQIVIPDTGTATIGRDMGVKDGQRKWYANDFSTKKMLILSGMGWGKLPVFLIRNELADGRLHPLEIADMIATALTPHHALKHENRVFGPVGESLWNALLQISASEI